MTRGAVLGSPAFAVPLPISSGLQDDVLAGCLSFARPSCVRLRHLVWAILPSGFYANGTDDLYDLFPFDDLDLSGQIYTDLAQGLITAG